MVDEAAAGTRLESPAAKFFGEDRGSTARSVFSQNALHWSGTVKRRAYSERNLGVLDVTLGTGDPARIDAIMPPSMAMPVVTSRR